VPISEIPEATSFSSTAKAPTRFDDQWSAGAVARGEPPLDLFPRIF